MLLVAAAGCYLLAAAGSWLLTAGWISLARAHLASQLAYVRIWEGEGAPRNSTRAYWSLVNLAGDHKIC